MNKTILHSTLLVILILFPFSLKAQTDFISKRKFEISLIYAAQCPLYSVNTPSDLSLSQDTRYRSRFGFGLIYYPYRRWYVEYSPSYSQEGGGYTERKTNADYFAHSFLLGFSTLPSNKIIFNMFCGIEMNFLLTARLINVHSKLTEDVTEYFNRFSISFPIGLGVKTRIVGNYYFGCQTFVSFSPYTISKESYLRASQIIFPAFQFSISKFIK